MEAFESLPEAPGVTTKTADSHKGKGLFATRSFREGDVIFSEEPFVSCQFAWNKAYKYLSCDFCMRPLETAEQNVRRLAGRHDIELPYKECCATNADGIRQCASCDALYCSEVCRDTAYHLHHRTLCHSVEDKSHPLERLLDAWKQIHFPPETANIALAVRLLAMIDQSSDPYGLTDTILQFCHRTVSDDTRLAHKLLGEQFAGQLEMLREMTAQVVSGPMVSRFLTPDGFCSLMALIGTNGQGIGTSPMAQWVNKVTALSLPIVEKTKLDGLIDKLYDQIEKESGSFLNTEGSGLYRLQSACNHSCAPNAEPHFPFNNHVLQLKALGDIDVGDEIYISYLDECTLTRSRHSRQKELASNYLFSCACEKCTSEACDPDETSVEEMSEDGDDDVEDMTD